MEINTGDKVWIEFNVKEIIADSALILEPKDSFATRGKEYSVSRRDVKRVVSQPFKIGDLVKIENIEGIWKVLGVEGNETWVISNKSESTRVVSVDRLIIIQRNNGVLIA